MFLTRWFARFLPAPKEVEFDPISADIDQKIHKAMTRGYNDCWLHHGYKQMATNPYPEDSAEAVSYKKGYDLYLEYRKSKNANKEIPPFPHTS